MADEKKLKAKFSELTRMEYVAQAKWFLNGFWAQGMEKEAETVWKYAHKFMELDPKKTQGCELDEFWSHKFLESWGETLTVIQLRERLKKIDLDANGKMALLEYLMFRYSKGIPEVCDCPQGDNSKELAEAQNKLNIAQNALDDAQKQLQEVQTAKAETAEKERQLEAKEKELRGAEAELKAAVDDLKKQEDDFAAKLADLDRKSKDASASQVNRSKAAAELAQLKQENPMPLRKAKITQEAALRKVEKQRKETEAAKEAARAARMDLEKKEVELSKAEEAARARLQEAEEFLNDVKKKGGNAEGAIWWLSRELTEKKKYLPKAKGGIDKK